MVYSKAAKYGIGKQKTEQVFPFVVLKHTRLWLLLFCSTACPDSEKNVLFAHSTCLPPRVLASQGTDDCETWRVYAPLSVGLSLPSLRAVGGLRLEVSLGTGGADPVLYHLFGIQNRRYFLTRKKKIDPEMMGQAPTSQTGKFETQPTYSYGPQTCKRGLSA